MQFENRTSTDAMLCVAESTHKILKQNHDVLVQSLTERDPLCKSIIDAIEELVLFIDSNADRDGCSREQYREIYSQVS